MKVSVVAVLPLLFWPAWGQIKVDTPVPTVSASTVAVDTPLIAKWRKAQSVLDGASVEFKLSGPSSVQDHADAIEQVLAQADISNDATSRNGDVYILADGAAESALALAIGESTRSRYSHGYGKIVVVDNPYPTLALMLGSYYDLSGRPADALRAFERGLALAAFEPAQLGLHVPALIGARSIALAKTNRLPQALKSCDDALASMVLGTADKARLYRNRGFILLKMDRLDEADAAYRQALELEPGNALAQQQRDAIAKRKAAATPPPKTN
jgi:tetratricopeptide (TPR) repeat protein